MDGPIPGDEGEEEEPLVGPALHSERMIIPFVPGISEKLKHIAGRYSISTWYTYSGRASDKFNWHRGTTPPSKIQNAIYSAVRNTLESPLEI